MNRRLLSRRGAEDCLDGVPKKIHMKSEDEDYVPLAFYRTSSGNDPVRDWLRSLPDEERKRVGDHLRSIQKRWPVGMPLVRPLGGGLCEVRVRLPNRSVRICFFHHRGMLIALHAFLKKSQAIMPHDLFLARRRMQQIIQSDHEI